MAFLVQEHIERLILLRRTAFFDKAKITFKWVKYHDEKFFDKDYRFVISGMVNGRLYDNDEVLIPASPEEALPPYTEKKNPLPIEVTAFMRDMISTYMERKN